MPYRVTIERVADGTLDSQNQLPPGTKRSKITDQLPVTWVLKEDTTQGCSITVMKQFVELCARGYGTTVADIGLGGGTAMIPIVTSFYQQHVGES